MNMFKKNGGFTLVELIVVIAILAILAGIAVPAYSGYLKSAEKAGDITTLSAVKTAAVASQATVGEVKSIEVIAEDGEITKITAEVSTGTESKEVVLYAEAVAGTTDESTGETTPGVDAKEDADFMTYMNNTMPTLKYFKDGAKWPVDGEWDEIPTETTGTNAG